MFIPHKKKHWWGMNFSNWWFCPPIVKYTYFTESPIYVQFFFSKCYSMCFTVLSTLFHLVWYTYSSWTHGPLLHLPVHKWLWHVSCDMSLVSCGHWPDLKLMYSLLVSFTSNGYQYIPEFPDKHEIHLYMYSLQFTAPQKLL